MTKLPQPSIRTLIITTVIAAAISGIIGALINGYFSRSKPHIAVTSLGFDADMIQISDKIKEASEDDAWGPSLHQHVHYDVLTKREQKASEIAELLKEAKTQVDEWLDPIQTNENRTVLSKAETKVTPYLGEQTQIIGSHLFGHLRRRTPIDLPKTLKEVSEYDTLWPLIPTSDGWTLHLQETSVSFNTDNAFSEREIMLQELIAESFSRGVAANIVSIHEFFASTAATEVIALNTLREAVRKDLAAGAHVVTTLSISNVGGTPIVLEPYLVAQATLGEDAYSFPLKMVVPEEKEPESLRDILDMEESGPNPKGDQGVAFVVDEYLRKTKTSPYIAVGPGESKEVRAKSLEAMGDQGEKLIQFFDAGALRVQVVGQTLGGKRVRSEIAMFGVALSDSKRDELNSLEEALQ